MSLPVDPPGPVAPPGPGSTREVSAGSTDVRSGPRPVPPPRPGAPAATDLPDRLGRFQVRAWLGEGSFAEVYLAHDPHLDREVALKVARPGTLGTARRVRRFLREARAAGNLRHPNIVPLYETGEDAGRHFLVTAYIPGRTLGAVIDEARAAGGLPLQEAVQVARKLAAALAYAHAEGVVHRDLKPDNVMVDEKGEPSLMDFGLAARSDPEDGDERLTQQGVAVGTPAYMAPEQARGEVGNVDPAADQYALGCTLYELLTGRTPFAGPSQVQLLLHQTEEPARPSRHARTVPRDLDAICLKCLAKNPKERYPSAADLKDDLDRFLRGEPVVARGQTLRYLTGKFVRRYRRSLTVASAILFFALAGTVAAFVRINAERADAVAASAREQGEREKAESEQKKAEKALTDLDQSRKEAQVVRDVVEQANTSVTEDNIRHVPGLSPVHEELAQIRLDGMLKLAKLTPDDPTVEPRVARAYKLLGQINARVGSFERAKENLVKAGEMYAALAAQRDDRRPFRLQECRAYIELARMNWDENRKAATRQWVQKALAWLEPEHARAPDDVEVGYEVGRAWAMLGGCLPPDTTKAAKEGLADRNVKLFERLIERKYREVDARAGLTVARYRLMWARSDDTDPAQHLKNLAAIVELDAAALKLDPTSPYLQGLAVFMHFDMAEGLRSAGRMKDSVVESEAAVAAARAIARAATNDYYYPSLLADALGKLASDYRRQNRVPDAQAALEETVQIYEALLNRFPDRAYVASQWVEKRNDLAGLFENTKFKDEIAAKLNLRRTLDGTIARGRDLAAKLPDHHWLQVGYARALNDRGRLHENAKRPDDALKDLLECSDVYRERILPDGDRPDPAYDIPVYLETLQSASSNAVGKPDDLLRLAQFALAVRKECVSRRAIQPFGRILNRAAKAHRDAGRHADALAADRQALAVVLPAYNAAKWHWSLRSIVTACHKSLAETYQAMNDLPNEVAAAREYAVLMALRDGKKPVEVTTPADENEAKALREYLERTEKEGMKRFTVPCDIGGLKYAFHVYVTNTRGPKNPIEDQARGLKEDFDATVPAEVIDSFGRLQKIADENNVSFVELCVYALGTAAATETKDQEFGLADDVPGAAEPVGKGGRDPLGERKGRLVELRAVLDKSPNDLKAKAESARLYQELGGLLGGTSPREAADKFREAVALYEQLIAAQPTVAHRRLLADVLLLLGRMQGKVKDFDPAYVSFHRRLDMLEQLQVEGPAADLRTAIAECHALLGELAERRGDGIEAQRRYERAIREGDAAAAKRMVTLLELTPAQVAFLPADLAAIYTRLKKKAPSQKVDALAEAFTDAVSAARKDQKEPVPVSVAPLARLADAANKYHEVAENNRTANRRSEYRAALAAEYEVRLALTAIDPKAHPKSGGQKVAAALVDSYLDTKETERAVVWYDRGVGGWVSLATLLKLGEYVEQGVGTKADPKKAEQFHYLVYYRRGKQSFEDRKYEAALPDLTKLCQTSRADGEDFNLLGVCLGKLGRWDEAIKNYRRSYQLDPADPTLALNLLEALVVIGQPKQACEFAAGLDKKKWPQSPRLARNMIFLAGLTAAAERLIADEDAPTPAERDLLERTSVPGLDLSWPWDELDAWLAKADLPAEKRAAVGRIFDEMKGRSPGRTTVHFPLTVGAKWTYTQRQMSDPKAELPDVVITVVAKGKVKGVECYKLERSAGKNAPTSEHVVVRYNGIYRVATDGTPLPIPSRLFALPAAPGGNWVQETPIDADIKFLTRKEDEVKVSAGTYTGVWAVREETDDKDAELVRQVWYADKVGPIKIETARPGKGKGSVVLELKTYQPGKGDKSK